MKNKGVSPVIATVLLVAMVVILGAIIFLWIRGMSEETITKFGSENIRLACEDVKIDASYSGSKLYVSNTGNVPIESLNVKKYSGGSFEIDKLANSRLNAGQAKEIPIEFGLDEVLLIPILLGKGEDGKEIAFECNRELEVSVD